MTDLRIFLFTGLLTTPGRLPICLHDGGNPFCLGDGRKNLPGLLTTRQVTPYPGLLFDIVKSPNTAWGRPLRATHRKENLMSIIEINDFVASLPNGKPVTLVIESIPADRRNYVLQSLVEYAVDVIGQRVLAGQGKLGTEEKSRIVAGAFARLQDGSYRFGQGSRESDPLVLELRSMADQAAREAGWKLTASREFVKEHGPVYGFVAAKLMKSGKMGSGNIEMSLVQKAAAENEETLIRLASELISRKTMEIVL